MAWTDVRIVSLKTPSSPFSLSLCVCVFVFLYFGFIVAEKCFSQAPLRSNECTFSRNEKKNSPLLSFASLCP